MDAILVALKHGKICFFHLPYLAVGNSIKKCLIAKEIDLEGCNNHNLVIDTLFAEVETHGVVIDTRSLG